MLKIYLINPFRYVAWNLHEMFKGLYNFADDLDLVTFIKLAQAEGLLVILRPGPYICAEWEYGGFPYWLIKEVPLDIRTTNKLYMSLVDQWFSILLTKMKPLLYSNGGPIISVQVIEVRKTLVIEIYFYGRFFLPKYRNKVLSELFIQSSYYSFENC